MKIYKVNVVGELKGKKVVFNNLLEVFDSREKAEDYVDNRKKEIEAIHNLIERREFACAQCDHDEGKHCRYCQWDEKVKTAIAFTTSNNDIIWYDCDPKLGDDLHFIIKELNLL